MIRAIVLTFNSSMSIERTLRPLQLVTTEIVVVDSFSSDQTVDICRKHGCKVLERAFYTYADQRNWAINEFQNSGGWQLHVDADEELDAELAGSIRQLDLSDPACDGFIVARRIVFMGRQLRFGGIARTWHMRLFRSGKGRVEDRLYDQHFICSGPTRVLRGSMLDHQELPLTEWTARHNRWSDLEMNEICQQRRKRGDVVPARREGNAIERKRYQKALYYRAPMFTRAFGYFFYRYIILLGVLDGLEGLIYHVLQGLWFRFLVDAKIYEFARFEADRPAKIP